MHGYPRLLATGVHKRPSSAVPVVCRGAPGCEQRALQEVGRKSAPWASSPHVVRHSAAAPAIVGPLVECLLRAQVAKSTGTPGCLQPGFTGGTSDCRFSASELSENPTSPAPLADACQHCGRLLSHLVLAYRDSVEDDYRHERPTATVYGPAIRLFHHILRP
jgi:hypothetical protein